MGLFKRDEAAVVKVLRIYSERKDIWGCSVDPGKLYLKLDLPVTCISG